MGRPTMPRKATIKHDRPKKHDEEMLTRDFTDQEIMEFREAFAMFDIDGGGTIEAGELKHVMTELGNKPTDEEIQDMINLVDVNGDNEIDFDEFIVLMRLRMGDSGEDAEQNLRDVFDIFDADGSGYIDRDEMRVLMKKLAQDLTEEEITLIMDEVDQDGDNQISFEEFRTLVKSNVDVVVPLIGFARSQSIILSITDAGCLVKETRKVRVQIAGGMV
eukprot:scaffold1581_cov169-Amphora_coffeaeformis.AAC.5